MPILTGPDSFFAISFSKGGGEGRVAELLQRFFRTGEIVYEAVAVIIDAVADIDGVFLQLWQSLLIAGAPFPLCGAELCSFFAIALERIFGSS